MSSRYSWEQEHNIVKITVQCLNPIINKPGYFDLFISRSYLKFHLKSPKTFMDFDLYSDIDPSSSLNKTLATASHLEIILAKSTPGQHWEALINPDKTSAKQRRDQSLQEVNENYSRSREAAEKARIDMDRLSVSEQMRLDGNMRKVLEDKILDEKNNAVKEIFSSKSSKQIFKDRTDIPEARSSVVQTLKFTPKRDPNMPARESTIDEPPIPNPLRPNDGPAHESHPLFLKDKGDEFFRNGDFVSAINAYTKALRPDPTFVSVILNRASCYLKIYEFDKALESLCEAEKHVNDDRVRGMIFLKKGAALVSKGMLADGILEYRKAQEVLNEESITQDIIAIEKRRESNAVKVEADQLYKLGSYEKAEKKYLESIEIDEENEISYANLAQVSLKLDKPQECLEFCDKALQYITHNTKLKVKVLLRKAKVTGKISFIEAALALDSLNPQAKALQAELQAKENMEKYEVLKEKADAMLKSGQSEESLQIYKQLLSTSKEKDQKISLLTNICVCYLMAKDFHGVVTTVQRAFKLDPKPSIRLRLLCRRASAYAELGQLYSAQCDLKEALQLDPENENIKNDLFLLQSKSN